MRFRYGFETCDANGLRNVKNQNLVKQKPVFSPPLLLGGVRHRSSKCLNQGRQFHAAIRVTTKRCDSCVQGALGRRTVSRRNFCDEESLAKRYSETCHYQPAPKYHTKGCSRSSVDSPGARTLVFEAFEPFSSHEFRASIARTPFCAILWRSPTLSTQCQYDGRLGGDGSSATIVKALVLCLPSFRSHSKPPCKRT